MTGKSSLSLNVTNHTSGYRLKVGATLGFELQTTNVEIQRSVHLSTALVMDSIHINFLKIVFSDILVLIIYTFKG